VQRTIKDDIETITNYSVGVQRQGPDMEPRPDTGVAVANKVMEQRIGKVAL